ncbi:S8 family serine peptidase [Phreatobacter sp.]|uniref:S8 family peptidase n=1 Tax=Phreatobacter sp. TaxID=1966341 RepID=UPI0025E1A1C3|nr:S8 family serine peptidase [Phreatobacter sp.]
MATHRMSGRRILAGLVATLLGTATLTVLDVRSAAAQFDLGAGLRSLGGGQNAGRGGERARPGAATQRRGQPSSQAPRATRRGQQAAPEAPAGGLPGALGAILGGGAAQADPQQQPGRGNARRGNARDRRQQQAAPQQDQGAGAAAALGVIAPLIGAAVGGGGIPGGPGGILPPGLPGGGGFGGGGGGRNAILGAAAVAIAVPAILSIIEQARANDRAAEANEPPGLPPADERRFVAGEVLFIMSPDAPRDAIRQVERRFGLRLLQRETAEVVGAVMHRYRVPNRQTVPAAIRAMQQAVGFAYIQPNYVFERPEFRVRLQSANAMRAGRDQRLQYVVDALRLSEAHQIARGQRVAIAVIDSGVDAGHPELAGRVTQSFDAVGGAFRAHEHGTGMAGAIVAQRQLLGVSPGADIYAVRAFAPGQTQGSTGTSFHIVKAMDWAIRNGARVINMSFAGPRDPMIARAIQVAADRRIAMIAAMGNGGPGAPIAFPAADPNVIAVTATDRDGRLFDAATQGEHVAVAAPGVEIILPAPRGGYQISSGTSVAAAHVSGIAALILERHPDADPATLRRLLQATARQADIPDPKLGAGVADPVRALTAELPRQEAPPAMATAPADPSPRASAQPAPEAPAAPAPASLTPR